MKLSDLARATHLTRSGDIKGATTLIQTLLRGGSPDTGASPPGPAAAAHSLGGRVEEGHADGGLRYRLYVPAGLAPGAPLIVMLHGCTQTAADFARGTGMDRLADEQGCLILYPEQTPAANQQRCWNWFRPTDQTRDRGEPALIAAAVRRVAAEHRVDPDRIYVAGLSAGGAAAAIMAAAYPDLFAAAGIHSGLACGAARDLPGALAAMRRGGQGRRTERFVPVITFHGDADRTVHGANSDAIVAAAQAAHGAPLVTEDTQGQAGRRYTRAVSRDAGGQILIEQWTVHGAGHAWSGGDDAGSYTNPLGPDASREMLRFFLDHRRKSD